MFTSQPIRDGADKTSVSAAVNAGSVYLSQWGQK